MKEKEKTPETKPAPTGVGVEPLIMPLTPLLPSQFYNGPISGLLYCPWCGSIDSLMFIFVGDDIGRPRKKVWCPQCDAQGPEGMDDAGAARQWNDRF